MTSLSDLANDLRPKRPPLNPAVDWRKLQRAADILAALQPLDDLRPPCDTCGGTGEVGGLTCLSCDRGRLAWDEHLRRIAAHLNACHDWFAWEGRQT